METKAKCAVSIFHKTFGLMRILASQKPAGPQGAQGPRGCQGPPGGDAIPALIDSHVCTEFSTFAWGIHCEFWSALAPPCFDPFALFGTDAQEGWTLFEATSEYKPAAAGGTPTHVQPSSVHTADSNLRIKLPFSETLGDTLTRGFCAVFAALQIAGPVALVADQARMVTMDPEHGYPMVLCRRTICSVGGSPYLVTAIETHESTWSYMFVAKVETLLPGPHVYVSPVEQFFLDLTVHYEDQPLGPSPACAVLTSLAASPRVQSAVKEGCRYVFPSKDTAHRIIRLFTAFLTATDLTIAVIGVMQATSGDVYAVVVPCSHVGAAYTLPYVRSPHVGAAVLVMNRDQDGQVNAITAIETPTGVTIVDV
jgi:hypothetical protein